LLLHASGKRQVFRLTGAGKAVAVEKFGRRSSASGSESASAHAGAGRLHGVTLGFGGKAACALRTRSGLGHKSIANLASTDIVCGNLADGILIWRQDLVGTHAHR
jgi:hypothetical protein